MPVEVAVDGELRTVPMERGRGQLALPSATSRVTIDPDSKLLRQFDAIDRYRRWDDAEKARKTPVKS